jgi:hypothetical protein
MMTLEEIQASSISPLVSREAHDQASKRLADLLDAKKNFEQKAFVLFNAYITLALALFGAGVVVVNTFGTTVPTWPFYAAGILFVGGAAILAFVLLDKDYGVLGSDPDMWLNRGTIDGGDDVVPKMLAYITFHHKERITKSLKANSHKATQIRFGIAVGLAAPALLLLGLG